MFNFTAINGNSSNFFYIGLYDKMITSIANFSLTQDLLFSATSQFTGKTKNFLNFATVDATNYERYFKIQVNGVAQEIPGLLDPLFGYIDLGNKDFPFGFYDIKIYQNDPGYPSNLDPNFEGLNAGFPALLYTGLLNVIPANSNPAVTYNEYTTNDTDTDSVYITN
jgi:hypothetical protein|tara:strand:- start:542 stop:1039 length:498 start_codon:yes stop_codon:yes gene_type:complete